MPPGPEHFHGSVGVTIGPMALRVLLLAAVLVTAAFASLRGFTGPPNHRTAVWVWSAAATVVVVELLLSGGLDFPQRLTPLVLAATAIPAYAIFSRDRRWAALRGTLRAVAPWPCAVAAILAAVELTRAWLTRPGEHQTMLLHTGAQLAAVAVSWLVISHPRPAHLLHTAAMIVALLILPGVAHATTLHDRSHPVPLDTRLSVRPTWTAAGMPGFASAGAAPTGGHDDSDLGGVTSAM